MTLRDDSGWIRIAGRSLVIAALALSCSAPGKVGPGGSVPRVEYHLRYDPDEVDPAWRIEVRAEGLANAKGLVLDLDDWGEWTSVDSYYLHVLESDPPLHRVGDSRSTFAVDAPPGWSGDMRVSYELRTTELGSRARERHGLLPYRAETYSFGFSANTLMNVTWDDKPDDSKRTIDIEAPPGWTIATGFGGHSVGHQRSEIPASIANTVISFGRPKAVAASAQGAIPVEVVQWGGASDMTADLLGFSEKYLTAVTASTGSPPTGPVRLMVTEPGFGGTRVDGAIAIGCPAGFDPDRDAGTLHFLAHEMFHDWLGGRLKSATEDETLCWFWEGFTDYLSLWQLAESRLVSRSWFAERLLVYETLASRAEGRDEHAYADPGVSWRDPAIEPLAYKGSALLAFSLDVALRRNGGPGLMTVIRDFGGLPKGRFALADIRAWVEGHGLAEFWRERFERPPPHTLREDLLAIGFVERETVEPLTYVGVKLDGEGPFGTVVAIDPDGPAAGIVQLGDRVTGLTPTREDRPKVPTDVATEYRFGLEWYEPTAESVRVDVQREGKRNELWIHPRRIDGPHVTRFVPEEGRLDAFFR